jgi:hypothetical protein
MPFNVSNFNAEISKSGIANPSFFEARIVNSPRAIWPMMSQGMAFRIESVNLPGRTLTTLDQNYHGPVRKIPYRFSHQPVTFSVIMSRDMREREAFMKWQDFFVGHYRTTQNGLSISPFDTQYYDDGIGTIEIIQYSYPITTTENTLRPKADKSLEAANRRQGIDDSPQNRGENRYKNGVSSAGARSRSVGSKKAKGEFIESYKIRLEEAYPSNINDLQMSWGDDGYAKLQVEIQYRYAVELHKTFANDLEAEVGKRGRVGGGLPQQYENLPINGLF